jgi:hypothetical protein
MNAIEPLFRGGSIWKPSTSTIRNKVIQPAKKMFPTCAKQPHQEQKQGVALFHPRARCPCLWWLCQPIIDLQAVPVEASILFADQDLTPRRRFFQCHRPASAPTAIKPRTAEPGSGTDRIAPKTPFE